MAQWADIATWRGTNNHGGPLLEHRGVVLHIAEGTYEGTISWCQNPSAEVSAHFVVAKDGRIAQLVDTGSQSWCQSAGNPYWLSIENEGHGGDVLTDAQIEACVRILAHACQVHGVPLQLADNPSAHGLGYHSMGGAAWGGHNSCPGDRIIAQRTQIITRACALVKGGDDMGQLNGEDPWEKGMNQAAELRNGYYAVMAGYQDSKAGPKGVIARLERIEAGIAQPAPVALTEQDRQAIIAQISSQVTAQVEAILRRLHLDLDSK
jgi:N-acetylmuramoyl-L-alanine amidase